MKQGADDSLVLSGAALVQLAPVSPTRQEPFPGLKEFVIIFIEVWQLDGISDVFGYEAQPNYCINNPNNQLFYTKICTQTQLNMKAHPTVNL